KQFFHNPSSEVGDIYFRFIRKHRQTRLVAYLRQLGLNDAPKCLVLRSRGVVEGVILDAGRCVYALKDGWSVSREDRCSDQKSQYGSGHNNRIEFIEQRTNPVSERGYLSSARCR